MLSLGAGPRVFVATEPVDMRGSFDALAGHVRRLPADPLDGGLYLFFSRDRRLLKALWFDRSGWAIFSKRLERGSFQIPDAPVSPPKSGGSRRLTRRGSLAPCSPRQPATRSWAFL